MADVEKKDLFTQTEIKIMIVVMVLFFVGIGVFAFFNFITAASHPTVITPDIYSSIHKPGDKFIVTLPGANGGTTQAEIMMMGSYESNYGEHNNGYSWYYNLSIKNIGDRGIQLPMFEYAEDNSGINVHVDPIFKGNYVVLHPGEVGTLENGGKIINKMYLLQSQQTPRGGGIYHLNLGGTIIDIKIPEISFVSPTPVLTVLITPTPSLTITQAHDPIIGGWTITWNYPFNSQTHEDKYRFNSDGTFTVKYYLGSIESSNDYGTWSAQGNLYTLHGTKQNMEDIVYDPATDTIQYKK